MEINRKSKTRRISDIKFQKKKYSERASDFVPTDKKTEHIKLNDYLSVSLGNSLKKIPHNNSEPKINPSSFMSPKASGYISNGVSTKS